MRQALPELPAEPSIDVWLIELPTVSRLLLDAPWPADSACGKLGAALALPHNDPSSRTDKAETVTRVRRTVHLALRLLLARSVGVTAAMQPFETGKTGKPRLPGGPAFSISHSGERALIALSRQGEVGVDIEAPRTIGMPANRQAMIRCAGIAAKGGAMLADGPPDAQTLQAWVRLEAIAKYNGDGMGHLLGRLAIIGGAKPETITPATDGYTLQEIRLDRGYFASVAAPPGPWAVTLRRFPETREGVEGLMQGELRHR